MDLYFTNKHAIVGAISRLEKQIQMRNIIVSQCKIILFIINIKQFFTIDVQAWVNVKPLHL
jgi:hypothetical protein